MFLHGATEFNIVHTTVSCCCVSIMKVDYFIQVVVREDQKFSAVVCPLKYLLGGPFVLRKLIIFETPSVLAITSKNFRMSNFH